MKTLVRHSSKLDTIKSSEKNSLLTQKVKNSVILIDLKSYQKIFLVFVALSIILIFPESPNELETICNFHHSRQICNVW